MDIVERLKAYRTGGMRGARPSICIEAADEIERLRAGLRIISEVGQMGKPYRCHKLAEEFLGEAK